MNSLSATRALQHASTRHHSHSYRYYLVIHVPASIRSRPLLPNAGIRRRLLSDSSSTSSSTTPINALRPNRTTKLALTALSGAGLLSLWYARRSVQVIRTGEVGVEEFWWGKMNPELLSPGSHVIHPFSTITKYSLQPRHRVYQWDILGQNGTSFHMEVAVVYKLDPEKIKEMYVETGTTNEEHDWHLEAVAKSMLQTIVAKTGARDVRRINQQNIAKELQGKLKEFYQKGINIELVVLKNIALPEHCTEGQKELDRLYYEAVAEQAKANVKGAKARSIANYHAVAQSAVKRKDAKSMFSAGVNSQHSNHQKKQIQSQASPTPPPSPPKLPVAEKKNVLENPTSVSKKNDSKAKILPSSNDVTMPAVKSREKIVKGSQNSNLVKQEDTSIPPTATTATTTAAKTTTRKTTTTPAISDSGNKEEATLPEENTEAASKTTEKQP